MNNNINPAVNMARMLNYGLHAQQLSIPILNEFVVTKSEDPQVVFMAQAQSFIEQVVSDGPLLPNESFEDRSNLVVTKTRNFMKKQNMVDPDNNYFYYKDYKTDVFNFKIYVQDMIFNVAGEEKVVRQLVANFLEPKFNDFYQVSIGVGPLPMPTQILKIGVVDLANDQITKTLDDMMNNILNNLKYRQENISKVADEISNQGSEREIEENKKIVFSAFSGGSFGPSNYFYIEVNNDKYLFKYGFSKDGRLISNNNKELNIKEKSIGEYKKFIDEIKNKIKDWEQNYKNGLVMDGTQWNIEFFDVEERHSGSNKFPSNFSEVMNFLEQNFK